MEDWYVENINYDRQGVIIILNSSGDTKLIWDKENKDEVENARRTFEELVRGKKFAAFSMGKMGNKGKKITEFSPELKKIILIPPIAGG